MLTYDYAKSLNECENESEIINTPPPVICMLTRIMPVRSLGCEDVADVRTNVRD